MKIWRIASPTDGTRPFCSPFCLLVIRTIRVVRRPSWPAAAFIEADVPGGRIPRSGCLPASPLLWLLAAMPSCHLTLIGRKPHVSSYLWKPCLYPTHSTHFGEHVKKRRFDLKMKAVECQHLLGVDKKTLMDWEKGKHMPKEDVRPKIVGFLG